MDLTDLQILNLQQLHPELRAEQIANRLDQDVNLIDHRISRIREQGLNLSYQRALDRAKQRLAVLIVLQVRLCTKEPVERAAFAREMAGLARIHACMELAGPFDFLLHLSSRDPQDFECFLDCRICAMPIVEEVRFFFVLRESRNKSG